MQIVTRYGPSSILDDFFQKLVWSHFYHVGAALANWVCCKSCRMKGTGTILEHRFTYNIRLRKIYNELKQPTRGRCYDHNFLRFSPIFGKKNLRFSQKTNVMIKILPNLALFCVKNANFFAEFFGENI
jgi:hypothetical protein